MDCWTSFWIDYPASYWCYCGSIKVEMGTEKTLHGRGFFCRRVLPDRVGMDDGDCWALREGPREGMHSRPLSHSAGVIGD